MKVFKIIAKTLRLILRSKTSLAAVLLGPLLIITLVGLAFGNMNQYSLNIGVFAHEYDELVESYLDKIQHDTTFKVARYPIIDLCLNDIKRGSTHTCIEFPRGFDLGVPGSNEIKFYVDQSKSDILAIVRTIVIARLSERTAEIASEQTEDVLQRIDYVNRVINEEMVVLSEISDLSVSTRTSLVSALDALEYFGSAIGDSTTDVGKIKKASDDIFKLARDIRDSAIEAIDFAMSRVDANQTSTLESRESQIIDYFNETQEKHKEISSIFNEQSSHRADMIIQQRAIESNVKSAQVSLDALISQLTGVRTSFADATGNFEGIDVMGAENLTAPIRTRVEPVVAEQAPLNYMFPILLVLVITLVSVMLAGTLVVMEKTSSSFFRNFVTPTANITFISGIFFTNVIVTLIQSMLIILVSTFVFGGAVLTNFVTIMVALFIIASLFTFIGMFLGYLFNTQEMVSLSGIMVSSLFILVSGILVPLEQMPEYMINISRYNPLLLGESILRKAIIFETEIFNETMMRELFLLILFTLAMLMIVIITQRIKKEMFLSGPNFFRRRRFFGNDADDENGKNGKKDLKLEPEEMKKPFGLDFLEDYTGMEDDSKKPKKKLNPIAKILSKLKLSKKEEIVFSGDDDFQTDSKKTDKSLEGMRNSADSIQDNDAADDESDDDSEEDLEEDDDDVPKGKSKSSSAVSKKVSKSPKKKQTSNNYDSEEPSNLLNSHLEPHQYFVLSSGSIVKSFVGLIDELKSMDIDTFSYHVGDDRNDFYLWIKNVLKSETAANKIKKIYDPKKMAKTLRKFV